MEKKSLILIIVLCVILALSLLFALTRREKAEIDYGTSELYSHAEMDSAIKEIQKTFNTFDGCRLYSLRYTSDELCQSQLEYCNTLAPEGTAYDACIVFDSRFRSPIAGGGSWNPNEIYTWTWYLARTKNGDWELLTYGYA